jgi:hypothetical protein
MLSKVLRDEGPPSPDRVRRGLVQTALWITFCVCLTALLWGPVAAAVPASAWSEAEPYLDDAAWLCYFVVTVSALFFLRFVPSEALLRAFEARDGRMEELRAVAAASLADLGAVDGTGALAAAASGPSDVVRRAARENLHRVVPLLSEEDCGTLETDTVPNLCRLLRQNDEPMALTALTALSAIGDGRAVRPVARLAASGGSSRVCEEAARVLTILKERQQRLLGPAILLRPSFAPGLNDDLLVTASNMPVDQLPRPAARS